MKILKLLNPMRYINGVKGTIALFLAVLMTPFLTIAMLLVEWDDIIALFQFWTKH
jgi:hypothetical protein